MPAYWLTSSTCSNARSRYTLALLYGQCHYSIYYINSPCQPFTDSRNYRSRHFVIFHFQPQQPHLPTATEHIATRLKCETVKVQTRRVPYDISQFTSPWTKQQLSYCSDCRPMLHNSNFRCPIPVCDFLLGLVNNIHCFTYIFSCSKLSCSIGHIFIFWWGLLFFNSYVHGNVYEYHHKLHIPKNVPFPSQLQLLWRSRLPSLLNSVK